MKAFFSVITFLVIGFNAIIGQGNLNIEQIAHVPNAEKLNDIWGYVAEDGTEYAIIGTRNATEIYSLADPSNPLLVKRVPGASTVWRDIKVLGNYAYVVADQPGSNDGVIIINMTNAPDDITFTQVNPVVNGTSIERCHNLYIDTSLQVMFLAGCNGNNTPVSGVTAFDITTDPLDPKLINTISTVYSHDVFVRDNLVFSSEVFAGQLSIFDIMDIMNPIALGKTPTTHFFTHNAWSSDDNQYVYTTDEVANGTIDAYDISDLENPARVDVFEPASIVGLGIVPHNTHFFNDFLITSWYDYGVVINDVRKPDKLIEVGHFNTGTNPNCWGVYPYLPSGLIIASDIDNGLFVLKAAYERAAYLTGKVTDAETGNPIFNAIVQALTEQPFDDNTNPIGEYAIGDLVEGNSEIDFYHPEYEPYISETTFIKGEIKELNAQLTKRPIFNQTIKTVDAITGEPISDVHVVLQKRGLEIEKRTDAEGFVISDYVSGDFKIIAGKWGYKYEVMDVNFSADGSYTIELEPGYQDDFIFDYDWTKEAPNTRSEWVRAIPIGTIYNGVNSNPSADVDGDLGEFCYVTGNGAGGAGAFDVDDGNSILLSPMMDLSNSPNATLQFNPWFFNDGGSGIPANDTLKVFASNGSEKVLLVNISENTNGWGPLMIFKLADFIALNDQVQISFEASDDAENGHLVEAGLDAFLVELAGVSSVENEISFQSNWTLFPNPVLKEINIKNDEFDGLVNYTIYNSAGTKLDEGQFSGAHKTIPAPRIDGVYFIQIKSSEGEVENKRFVVTQQ
ncbi:choice-of-anchor B family protein [Portibacter lacus]|uniref:Secretion system C-terminal sorting domain-containing protein n=1 Tax=Portibacter lacus TaxID=1099794 RepID=A0AA37SK93_9BACT|nr:choice-of-anchor B family protein [Portibacter lacus]GLR15512.1 hypothetical protein GCM10007940_01270 [Portibacter lacus]